MRAATRYLSLGALLLLAACSHDEPRVTATVQGSAFTRLPPEGSTYAVAAVPFVIRNRGDRTVFIPVCGSRALPIIDRFEGGHWAQYSGGACVFSSVDPPNQLRAGASDTSLVTIGEAGRYRLRVTYANDASFANSRTAATGAFSVR